MSPKSSGDCHIDRNEHAFEDIPVVFFQFPVAVGSVPKGYFLQLDQNGECRLVLIRGQKDKENPEGGESVLGAVRLNNAPSSRWHNLRLRFDGSNISALVDGNVVLRATDTSYARGMVGLMTGGGKKLSMSYFDNVFVRGL